MSDRYRVALPCAWGLVHQAWRDIAKPVEYIVAKGNPGSQLPDCYVQAEWRNVTPVDRSTGRIGISFDLPEGTVMRFAVDRDEAERFARSILAYAKESRTGVHSEISSGSPSEAGFTPEEGQ